MGRKVRRVPEFWDHPKDRRGRYIPLSDGYFGRITEWAEESKKWDAGFVRDYGNNGWKPKEGATFSETYAEYAGGKPDHREFMPDWPAELRTHWQMYEDTSEGTPISRVFATPEELARWLADTGASAFAYTTASYEEWLATINQGGAVSMVFSPREGLISGVAASNRKI